MEPWPVETLIGREHPAGLLRAEVDRLTTSHGGLVLVAGEPGIGKTTLVTAVAAEARRRGALVLGAACWDSDSAPGYWPWVQVLRRLRRSADDWAPAREAAEPALAVLLGESTGDGDRAGPRRDADGDPGDGDREEFRLHDAVTSALVAVAQRRPVVVVLDDLHWADRASLRLLRFAAQHTWFERLLLVGTYRDAELEAGEHRLAPLLTSLTAKATTITLTGLGRDEVAALIARTAGRTPDAGLVDEVHRRTGGNPFFVEQTARLWRADGLVTTIAPGVREAVRRRLAQLPAPVVEALTVAAVLGPACHRQLLAACVPGPAAQIDRLLDRAVAARLVVARGGGRFAFAHDLVRETLYDGLPDDERRARHAAVVRAVDGSASLAEWLIPAELARHAWLAGADLDPSRAVELLVAAGRDAGGRLAGEESIRHFRRALELDPVPVERVKIMMELAEMLRHTGESAQDESDRLFADAAALALTLDDPVLLARVAVATHRRQRLAHHPVDARPLLHEAYRRLIGEPGADVPVSALLADLITATETLARRGQDDEALTFSLWARHDTTWGPGTAAERAALTAEIREVARRTGDRDTELWATSLRWVALLELGDPGYHHELTAFVTGCRAGDVALRRVAAAVDSGITAGFRGDFAAADADLAEVDSFGEWEHTDHAYLGPHLRWARLLLQGRFDQAARLLDGPDVAAHPHAELLRAITAAERGDADEAVRLTAGIEAAGTIYSRAQSPLWLRLRAQAAALSRDPRRCDEAHAALAPYRGQWLVALFGCDLSGPVDHWLAVLDAARGRWDDAVAGFTAARDAADRMAARPWSLVSRAGLVAALSARGRAGDASAAAEQRAAAVAEARALGMTQVLHRLGATGPPDEAGSAVPLADPAVAGGMAGSGAPAGDAVGAGVPAGAAGTGNAVGAGVPAGATSAGAASSGATAAGVAASGAVPGEAGAGGTVAAAIAAAAGSVGAEAAGAGAAAAEAAMTQPAGVAVAGAEFRRDGAVWRLAYAGTVVHLPDAKGLHDLRLLLGRPGVDVPAVELLDPAAGPELVAARRYGGDPVLDDEAKARYQRHLRRLDEEIDRAAARDDRAKLAALDAEREALLDQLRAAAGLAGRTRRLDDQAERARKAVTARIRDTLRRIDERHPVLAAHLRETVSTGSACRYLPPEPPPWRL
ncbi:AAA family ATPase [Micromonospora sp. PLK6-60]|uniref:ATP-binding protein n=1 Tax=Micromonospora sp. PLK6-60 TaxID=2873383 RepID=UPI001CA6553F|nr:AAA family ATPase [Micromonospora sp. PLK6-60]MBY8872360.1 AAA family ATPase [Micromonospora sp. PLK6-60]